LILAKKMIMNRFSEGGLQVWEKLAQQMGEGE
jgi:hypothetical protein